MPKGPLGAPRPFSEYRIIIDPHARDVHVVKQGPFGLPRPLAKNNPPVSDNEIAECIVSESGRAFGAGVVSNGATTKLEKLPPRQRQEALAITEKWCEGTLEGMAVERIEEGDGLAALSRIREQFEQATGKEDEVTLEMVDEGFTLRREDEEKEAEVTDIATVEE